MMCEGDLPDRELRLTQAVRRTTPEGGGDERLGSGFWMQTQDDYAAKR